MELAPAIDAYSKTYREIAELAGKERKTSSNGQALSKGKKVAGQHG